MVPSRENALHGRAPVFRDAEGATSPETLSCQDRREREHRLIAVGAELELHLAVVLLPGRDELLLLDTRTWRLLPLARPVASSAAAADAIRGASVVEAVAETAVAPVVEPPVASLVDPVVGPPVGPEDGDSALDCHQTAPPDGAGRALLAPRASRLVEHPKHVRDRPGDRLPARGEVPARVDDLGRGDLLSARPGEGLVQLGPDVDLDDP